MDRKDRKETKGQQLKSTGNNACGTEQTAKTPELFRFTLTVSFPNRISQNCKMFVFRSADLQNDLEILHCV